MLKTTQDKTFLSIRVTQREAFGFVLILPYILWLSLQWIQSHRMLYLFKMSFFTDQMTMTSDRVLYVPQTHQYGILDTTYLISILINQHNLNIKLSWIKTTGKIQNFPDFVGSKIHYHHFNKLINQNPLPDQDAGFCSVSQFSPISSFSHLQRSGVVSCCSPQCWAIYIGQTGRKFSTRVYKHTQEADKYHNNFKWDTTYIKLRSTCPTSTC